MKRLLLVLLVFSSTATATTTGGEVADWAAADARVDANTATQRDYQLGYEYIGFVGATLDIARASHKICDQTYDVSGKEIFATVSLFLREHPQRWHEPGFQLVLEALQQVLPCRK